MFARIKEKLDSRFRNGEPEPLVPLAYGDLIEEQHDSRFARLAIRLGALTFGVFILWACFTPVHEITPGEGVILPNGFVRQVQHQEGGGVRQVLVDEGQAVRAGAPLVVIDDTQVRAELAKARARDETLRLAIERARAFVDGRSADLTGTTAELRGIVDSQRAVALFEDGYREAQLAVLRSEISMKEAERAALRIRRDKAEEERVILARQLADFDAANRSGAISRRERDSVERETIRLDIEIADINGQYAATQAAILQAKARETELASRFRQESLDEIAELEGQRAETQELVTQLAAKLKGTIVRAPTDGLVHNLAVRNAGAVIRPGDVVAEIVPSEGNIFAEVDVPTAQIGYVEPDMVAKVKVLTYDSARFGSIEATVDHISPAHFERQDGTTYFRVRLRLDSMYVGPESAGRRVRPGMSVIADIRFGDKSVMSYLLKPLRAISDRAFSET